VSQYTGVVLFLIFCGNLFPPPLHGIVSLTKDDRPRGSHGLLRFFFELLSPPSYTLLKKIPEDGRRRYIRLDDSSSFFPRCLACAQKSPYRPYYDPPETPVWAELPPGSGLILSTFLLFPPPIFG